MPGAPRSTTRARLAGATIAAAGLGLLAWTVGISAAMADPDVPVDPAAPPAAGDAPPAPQTMLGQFAAVGQSNPFNMLTDLITNSPQPAVIGATPPPPGSTAADPMTLAQILMPQNYRMPGADQASPYALSSNDNPSPFARIEAWRGVHALTHGSLGRMPGAELGQPLPGTAPMPGSNLPPGLEQFYVDPAAVPATTPPVATGIPPGDSLLPQPLPPA